MKRKIKNELERITNIKRICRILYIQPNDYYNMKTSEKKMEEVNYFIWKECERFVEKYRKDYKRERKEN